MNRLDELGERMRTEEDWPRPSVATLRARHRSRRRAVSSVVIAGLVLVVGAGVWINAVSEKTADVVGSGVEVFDGPTVPSYERIPAVFQPTGPVDIVDRGKLGGTNWYSIVYPAAGGLQCSGVIDVHGEFLAGGSCGSGSGSRAGTSFSFGNIGGVDVMYGNAADDVEVVEVALTDGTSLRTIPKRSSLYGARTMGSRHPEHRRVPGRHRHSGERPPGPRLRAHRRPPRRDLAHGSSTARPRRHPRDRS